MRPLRFSLLPRSSDMDNQIADHLASILHQLGLEGIQETPQHEETCREDAEFANRIGICLKSLHHVGTRWLQTGQSVIGSGRRPRPTTERGSGITHSLRDCICSP